MRKQIVTVISIFSALLFATSVFSQLNFTRNTLDNNLSGAYWVYSKDIDRDGDMDLVTASQSGVHWWKNNGAESFSKIFVGSLSGAWTAYADDIDQDGHIDILGGSPTTDEVLYWRNNGGQSFTKIIADNTAQDPETVVAADMDGDGDDDILVSTWIDGQIVLFENTGGGNFSKHVIDSNMSGAHSVAAGDLDGDGDNDIAASSSGKTRWYKNSGNLNFSQQYLASSGALCVFIVDIDRDGDNDVLRSQRNNGDVDLLQNSGGSFSERNIESGYGECWSVTAGDLDGDGDIDVAAAGFAANNIKVWLNDGHQNFGSGLIVAQVNKPRSVFIADFDGDGDGDIVSAIRDDADLIVYNVGGRPSPVASISIIHPNGSEIYFVNSLQTITWSSSASVGDVSIELSTDNGNSWTFLSARTANTGNYDWIVPDVPTSSALIRITDINRGSVADVSDGVFTITTDTGVMQIAINCDDIYDLYVNGNLIGSDTIWDHAQTYSIPLISGKNVLAISATNSDGPGGLIAEVKINGKVKMITDSNWVFNSSEVAGWQGVGFDDSAWNPSVDYGVYSVAPWMTKIVNFPKSSTAHWIWEADSRGLGGYFRGSFVVGTVPQVPQVTSYVPASAAVGDTVAIAGFDFTGAVAVSFNGIDATNFTVISDMEIVAIVPVGATTGKISVVNADGRGESFTDFIVNVPVGLSLTTPNGRENWAINSTQKIIWQTKGTVSFIRLEYSADRGVSWVPIVARLSNSDDYNWRIPDLPANEILVRVSDADSADIFDVSDNVFLIFNLKQNSVSTIIPNPRTLTIDDVGWQLGKDVSNENGPFRLGTLRDPVLSDYEVLTYVAEKVGTRLSAKFILSEFDRENILAKYPTTNEFGVKWDNSALTGPQDFTFMDYVKQNTAWIEFGMHGVRHEFWDWQKNQGKMIRTEFYNEIENYPWPAQQLKNHMQAFKEILLQYGIVSYSRSFVPGGEGYYYAPDSLWDTGSLLASFGAKYAASSLIRAGTYGVPQSVIQEGGIIDRGVLWIQEAPMFDETWPLWNAVASAPTVIPADGIPITHWPNWWAPNPNDNFTTGDKFVQWFNLVKQQPDMYVPKNNAQYYSQWLYRKFAITRQSGNTITIDNTNMIDDAYTYDLLGNLVLKIQLQSGQHVSQFSINNNAEIVGYYEDLGYGYVMFSQLGKQVYDFIFQMGTTEPDVYLLNDGTYNVSSFQTFSDSAYISLEMYGTQDMKFKLPFVPAKVQSNTPDLIVNSFNFDGGTGLLTINVSGKDIMGQKGEMFITSTRDTSLLSLTSPNGGEVWVSGGTQNITWTSLSTTRNVKLEFSGNSGLTWQSITDSTLNDGSYTWIVPNLNTDSCLVRVSDVRGVYVDESDAVFAISLPFITVTTPNGGEIWMNRNDHTISWTSQGNIGNVNIDYSLDGGTNWNVITTSTLNTGSYVWAVPVIASGNVLVRVSDAIDATVFDESEAVFSINGDLGKMEVSINADDEYELYVNGSLIGSDVNWDQAQTYSIPLIPGKNVLAVHCMNTGGPGGLIAEVKIAGVDTLLSGTSWVRTAVKEVGWTDIGFDDTGWQTVKDLGAYGAAPWKKNIQGLPVGSLAHWIWETDSWGPGGYFRGSFDNGRTGSVATITSFVPTSGVTGTSVTITGRYFTGATHVLFNRIGATAFSVDSDSVITATVPITSTGPISVVTALGTGVSATNFTFLDAPSFTLTSPNGGETWLAGSTQSITWVSTDTIANVKIEYSGNNGTTWQTVVNSTPNDGRFDWILPIATSDSNLVKLSDVIEPGISDSSNAVFTIVEASLTLSSPNDGETLGAGVQHTILWTTLGTIANVDIDYSIDNGSNWVPIVTSFANSGSYSWTVPSVETGFARVRVSDAADGVPADVSDTAFIITMVLGDMKIVINADDQYEFYVNGALVGSDTTWNQAQTYLVPAISGKNVLAVYGTNPNGPGGLLAEVNFNGETVLISDTSWVFNATEVAGWWENGFDDTSWIPAVDYGVYGVAPWKKNIRRFPVGGSAHWIWETDSRGTGGYFRGSFVVGQVGPPPGVTLFTPTSGAFGDTVTISGLNFTGTTSVQFNGVPATAFTVISDTKILVTVPVGASTGKISVVNNSGTGSSVNEFVVNVTASLTLTSPNGGENFLVGTQQTITWTSTGDIPLVKLEASFDSGATWAEIIVSTDNAGNFDWTVPVTPASESLVRISDVADGDPSDISDAGFAITNSLGTMEITINADDEFDLYVNGEFIGTDISWNQAQTYTTTVLEGKNVIAVHGRNTDGAGGFIAEVKIDGQLVLQSDNTWKRIAVEQTDWFNPNFDDSAWFDAVDHGQYGVGPWNTKIVGFPSASTASWIWSADELDAVQFFRGTFYAGSPQVTSISPASGGIGTEVTLTGANFSATGAGNFSGSGAIRIMPLGDSITKGVTGSTDDAGYRNDLAALLDTQGIVYDFVGSQATGFGFDNDHEGHNGYWADEILAELDTWINLNPPDMVLFHIGTNDISSQQTNASTISEIGQDLDIIKNFDPNIVVILASIVPRRDRFNSTTDDLNQRIANLVSERALAGDNIYYAGINEAFVANSNWATDYFPVDNDIHPNDTGYSVMANVWFDAIVSVLNDVQNLTVGFNGAIASNVVVDSDNQMRAIVPAGATSGPISVTNLFGTAFSISDFVVNAAAAPASLVLSSPSAGENWDVEGTHVISWKSSGQIDRVNVSYSKDNGSTWNRLAGNIKNDGKFVWRLTADEHLESAKYVVKVSDVLNSNIADKSQTEFTFNKTKAHKNVPTFNKIKEAVLGRVDEKNEIFSTGDLNHDDGLDIIDLLYALDMNLNQRNDKYSQSLLIAETSDASVNVLSPQIVLTNKGDALLQLAATSNVPIRAFQVELTFDNTKFQIQHPLNFDNFTGMQIYTNTSNNHLTVVGYYLKEKKAKMLPKILIAFKTKLTSHYDGKANIRIEKAIFVSRAKQAIATEFENSSQNSEIPSDFSLFQNYPNPFNLETQIKYNLPQKSRVKIQIFNLRGELVRRLLDEEMQAGQHTIAWDAKNDMEIVVASGIYLYRISAARWKTTRKMILLK